MAKKKPVKIQKKSSNTLYYLIAAVIIIGALAFYLYSAPKPVDNQQIAGDYIKLNIPSTHEPGKVKIIEILKFDCPHCYNLNKELPSLLNKYGDKIEITYIPVVWNGQSTKSIEAYIIAKQMGKGQEMKDAMFEAQANGKNVMESSIALEDIASQVGLNTTEFNIKLKNGSAENETNKNIELMNKYAGLMKDLGISFGTPAIIIDGNILPGKVQDKYLIQDITNMELVIDSLLK